MPGCPTCATAGERLVGLMPFSHSFGLTACLNWPMSQGAQIIVLPRFEINGFIKMLRKHRPTMLPGVPTLFVALINDPRLAKLDLSALWGCISGSAPLPVEVRDRFEALSGCRMMEGYGLTEAGPVTHLNPVKGKRPLGSMGMPLPGTLARVMDQETGGQRAACRGGGGTGHPGAPGDAGLLAKGRGNRRGAAGWLALYRRPGPARTPTAIFTSWNAKRI